jgi:hypothetical protein
MALNGFRVKIYSSSSTAQTSPTDPAGAELSYTGSFLITTVDPNTSSAWTESGINAAEAGVSYNSTGTMRVSAMYLSVEALAPSGGGGGTTYTETGSGGIVGGSTATIRKVVPISITSAGARGGSTATISKRSFLTPTGGSLGAASATVLCVHRYTGSGGSLGAASAFILSEFYYTGTGGTVGAGIADVDTSNIGTVTVSGGARSGGLADTFRILNNTGSGGSVGGSAARVIRILNNTGSGGSVGAGTATKTSRYRPTPTGGILGAGTATVIVGLTSRGGVVGGSTATVAARYRVTPTGGIKGGSTGRFNMFYRITTTTAGVRANGGSTIRIDFRASGGAVLAGTAKTSVGIYGNGGAKLGGSGDVAAYFTTIFAQGGVKAGGKIKVARLKQFTPVKTGIGRALASDNILKPKLPTSLLLQPFGSQTPAAPTTVRTQDQAQWNEITESSEDVLPPITIKIQRPYLPPKRRGTVARDRQFATLTTS